MKDTLTFISELFAEIKFAGIVFLKIERCEKLKNENSVTVKDYAEKNNITVQAVYSKIKKKGDTLENHVFKQGGVTYLDEAAQEILKPIENVQIAAQLQIFQKNCHELEERYGRLQGINADNEMKILELERDLLAERQKNDAAQRCIGSLTEKLSGFSKTLERLNLLLDVLEENTQTAVGKKIGSLLSGKG